MQLDLDAINAKLESATPLDILEWAWGSFGVKLSSSSSFQTQSVPLLAMISQVSTEIPIFFLDTGFHFPETLVFRDELIEKFKLKVISLRSELGHFGFNRKHGELYRRDPDLCCHINKTEPLEFALADYSAWITGIRRDQTRHRQTSAIVSQHPNGRYKICPLANWTKKDVWKYISDHDLPSHPLLSEGYMSIGCAPCTARPLLDGDDRSGRWAGRDKVECGIHTQI